MANTHFGVTAGVMFLRSAREEEETNRGECLDCRRFFSHCQTKPDSLYAYCQRDAKRNTYSVQFSDRHYASSSLTLEDEREGWAARMVEPIEQGHDIKKYKKAGSTHLRGRLRWTVLGYNSDLKTL